MSTKFLALAAIALLFCGVRGMDDMTDTGGMLDDSEVKGDWTSIADLVDSKNGTATLWTAIMEVLNAGELTDLADALTSENTTATVFAPTDEAFALLGAGTLDALLADPAKLADIIRYHVVVGEALTLADIKAMDGMLLDTALAGPAGQLKIRQGGKKAALLTTNGVDVPIYQYNIKAGQAVVHTIKQVLVPGTMVLTAGSDGPAPTMAPMAAM